MSFGKIVEVDLTSGKITFADHSAEMARNCLGGLGFNSWYLYRHVPEDSALDPENVLVISCGLLTGTPASFGAWTRVKPGSVSHPAWQMKSRP